MSWFRRKNRLPDDIISMMERFGRFEWDPQGSPENASDIWEATQAPMLEFATSDPSGFIADLIKAVQSASGWAKYGAARTVENLMNPVPRQDAMYAELMDASLQFLRGNGAPPNRLSQSELDRWRASGGTLDDWLPRRPTPTPETSPVTPLGPTETRRVVESEVPGSNEINVILVEQAEQGRFVAQIAAKHDDGSLGEGFQWKSSDSLFGLYYDVALAMQTPPLWFHPELEPFFPLPPPSI